MKTDFRGQPIDVGDVVVIGYDNGSTLAVGKIFKLTPKKVWLNPIVDHVKGRVGDGAWCRDYDRVVKLCAVGVVE